LVSDLGNTYCCEGWSVFIGILRLWGFDLILLVLIKIQLDILLLMAKAQSFKNEPWTALERGAYSIFEDDFVH